MTCRCSGCGTLLQTDQPVCTLCGTTAIATQLSASDDPATDLAPAVFQTKQDVPWAQSQLSSENPTTMPQAFDNRNGVTGRVIAMEPLYLEDSDFDTCRLLTILIWLLILLASPILAVYGLLVFSGTLPAVLACIGLFLVFRAINPLHLLSSFQMFYLLNPFRHNKDKQVPVRYLRVRVQQDASEVMARIKGTFTAGNVAADDLVTLLGRWHSGVLFVRNGENQRTRSRIELQRSHSWVGLALTVIVILSLVSAFYGPTKTLLKRTRSLNSSEVQP